MTHRFYAFAFAFAFAGLLGFCVDVTVLYASKWIGIGIYLSRLVSFVCAAFTTWQINRNFAFRERKTGSFWSEWLRYLSAMAFGGMINLGVYALVIRLLPDKQWVPLLGVVLGTGMAMGVNFITSKRWVFKIDGV